MRWLLQQVDDRGVVKLADFGASERTTDLRSGGAFRGTPYFWAIEILQRQPHGLPVDIWALGVSISCYHSFCFCASYAESMSLLCSPPSPRSLLCLQLSLA
jgi:serine/threonine protein kinase